MRYSYAALVLATAFAGNVAAGPVHHAHQHQHFHAKKDAELVNGEANVERRGLQDVDWAAVHYTYSSGQTWGQPTAAPAAPPAPTTPAAPAPAAASPSTAPAANAKAVVGSMATTLTDKATSLLSALGVKSAASDGGSWVGTDGPWTADFFNKASEDVTLAVWGAKSWLNANNPSVLVTIPVGAMTTVSFKNGVSGAWAGIYSDTDLRMGQINNTWGEYTFGDYGVVDVSREVNMAGHDMTIESPNGCISDRNTCVFVCHDGDGNSCWLSYTLKQSSDPNCIKGYDSNMKGESGGCSLGQGASSGKVKVTFH